MTITYSMRNVNSESVRTVMLRKFFQMVFIGNDKKAVHIYTATVLGASAEACEEGQKCDNDSAKDFISRLDELKTFRMRFEFAVGNIDNNEVLSIDNIDITDTEHGLLNEIECIRNVWGRKCDVLHNNQEELSKKVCVVLNVEKEEKKAEINAATAELTKHRILWTEEKKNGAVDAVCFRSLSTKGHFEKLDYPEQSDPRDKVAKRGAYAVSVPDDIGLLRGMELVSWVRTTIRFKYPLDETDFNYFIRKDMTGEDKTIYYAPDFTWYFSPKVKSFIDNRNSFVEIKRGNGCAYERCICPIQEKQREFYSNDKYQNSIDPVPNKLTVEFHYWKEEDIKLRQKYRLASKDMLPTAEAFAQVSGISIFLDTADEHNRGNRQFMLGIFLSFVLAFGIDSTRLKEVEGYFPTGGNIPADIWWIIFLVLLASTLVKRPPRLMKYLRPVLFTRKVLMLFSLMWSVFVFGICRIPEYNALLINNNSIYMIARWGFGVIILLQVVYLGICAFASKDNLWVDLFGEDIL